MPHWAIKRLILTVICNIVRLNHCFESDQKLTIILEIDVNAILEIDVNAIK